MPIPHDRHSIRLKGYDYSRPGAYFVTLCAENRLAVFADTLLCEKVHAPGRNAQIWQRNYYEHVIRNEIELNQARSYILNNPASWALDHENPEYKSS
jgi:hypothetical protein